MIDENCESSLIRYHILGHGRHIGGFSPSILKKTPTTIRVTLLVVPTAAKPF
jgi:hypothetical protein